MPGVNLMSDRLNDVLHPAPPVSPAFFHGDGRARSRRPGSEVRPAP